MATYICPPKAEICLTFEKINLNYKYIILTTHFSKEGQHAKLQSRANHWKAGKRPEKRTTRNGTSYTVFPVAVDRRWKSRDGSSKKETDWFNVEAWGKLGDICINYLSKGRTVFLEGACGRTVTIMTVKRATSPR
jgi:glutamate synthase domain-containing protein 3